MRPTELKGAMITLTKARVPIFLWGPPGVGKSDVVRQMAAELAMELIDVRAVLLDSVDLRGLPHVNGDGLAHWAPPAFLPRDPESIGILFIDELPQAPPLVQSALLQLVLDRKLGEYVLPPGWVIIAAGNRVEDRAGSHRVLSSLSNRFVHLDFDVNVDDWLAWAMQNGIAAEVRSFIMFRRSLLHEFDATKNERAFPTPRSWEFVSRILKARPALSDAARIPVISGCVGEKAAAEFRAFLEMYTKMPDVNAILNDPENAPIPPEPAILWALVGTLSDKMKNANNDLVTKIAKYGTRMVPEFAMLLLQQGYLVNPATLNNATFREWARKYGDLFAGATVAA